MFSLLKIYKRISLLIRIVFAIQLKRGKRKLDRRVGRKIEERWREGDEAERKKEKERERKAEERN